MLYNVYCICRLCSAWVNPCRCAASGVCRINLPPPQQTAPRSRNKSTKGKLKTRIAQVLLGSNINMRNYVAPHYGSDFQLLHYINAMDFFFFRVCSLVSLSTEVVLKLRGTCGIKTVGPYNLTCA